MSRKRRTPGSITGRNDTALKINEIFHSIQGESSHAGRPCVFVRLTGCNLRCSYCDTTYAYEEGAWLSVAEIEKEVRRFDCRLVEITGGEPLLQEETAVLIRGLLDQGFTVLMETNGSRDIRLVDERCIRIVDVKCPSSGEAQQNRLENLDHLTACDEIKFVIGDREDYAFAKGILSSRPGARLPRNPPLFSPVSSRLSPEKLAEWILEDHLAVRFQLQLHKVIWGEDRRGV